LPIQYTVHFPAPGTHYAEVEASFPTGGLPYLDLFMAVWTPGSYLIREFARNVEGLANKIAKNRWRVASDGGETVTVRYRVYCHEMSVRTNWVDERFAFLNGAATFISVVGQTANAHEVKIILPSGWTRVMTALPETAAGYLAADYDTLVDSPILAGNPGVCGFEVDGKPHVLANVGETPAWDSTRAAADVETIVRYHEGMWGQLPYDRFLFLNLIVETGGGLEHKNSLCVMTSRWAMRTRAAYLQWLVLMAHEHFHVWNVKRLRPAELGPFDYEHENYTRGLWVAEGLTEYYGSLNVRRAGLATVDEYLGMLSDLIETLQKTPGRLELPVESASFDAWIKLYRPDENSANCSISYYVKGGVIAWLLDAKIRRARDNAKSLDDVLRLAYTRFSGRAGFTGAEFRETVQEVAGMNLEAWFHDALETAGELDYSEALDWFGLRFKTPEPGGKSTLGFVMKIENGRMTVAQTPRGTAAYAAGFSADDEILAMDGFRVRPEQWQQRMEQYRPGERVSVLVARRERILSVDAVMAREHGSGYQLEIAPGAAESRKRNLSLWLESV
jgi:predicted metalloprotease with PDZ domain